MAAKHDNKSVVKVFIRQRPFSAQELEKRVPDVIKRITSRDIVLGNRVQEKKYSFDEVFGHKTSQKEIYSVVVAPLIDSIVSGYNCTVFAYGQTGTGKTHTIIGEINDTKVNLNDSAMGLIPRAANHLFAELSKLNPTTEYAVRVSFIEMYNEELKDLLSTRESPSEPIRIYDDSKGQSCIRNINELTVCNTEEVFALLQQGTRLRQTAATNCNRQSSRSHTVFTLIVHTREITTEGDEIIKTGKLNLVDLAGSENVGRSGATDLRAREAGTINKSLLTLAKVIKALIQKQPHIPYRDSKLTRILQDSLGGKTKTCMIATISPSLYAWDETISTLEYASMARNVVNCPEVNINKKHANLVKDLTDEIAKLRRELTATRTGEGFFISQEAYDSFCSAIDEKRAMEEEYLKIMEAFAKNNEYLERLKKVVKENKVILNYMTKRDDHVSTTAEQLISICETMFNRENILQKNYGSIFQKSIKNMALYKNASDVIGNYVETISTAIETFIKTSISKDQLLIGLNNEVGNVQNASNTEIRQFFVRLDEINRKFEMDNLLKSDKHDFNNNFLTDYFNKMFDGLNDDMSRKFTAIDRLFEQIANISKENNSKLNNNILALIKNAENEFYGKEKYSEECEKTSKMMMEQLAIRKERQKKASIKSAKLKEQLMSVMQLVEELHADNESDSCETEQEIIDKFNKDFEDYQEQPYLRCIQDTLDSTNEHVQKAIEKERNLISEGKKSVKYLCSKTAEDVKYASKNALTTINNLIDTVSENVASISQETKETICDMEKRSDEMSQKLSDYKTKIQEEIEKDEQVANEFSQDAHKFTLHIKDEINACNNELATLERNGDTPSRHDFKIPRKIEKRLPRHLVLEQFDCEFDELDEIENIPPTELNEQKT